MQMHYPLFMEILKAQATLTARYQTTVPTAIRKVLGLSANDKLEYTVDDDGRVVLTKGDPADHLDQFDPAVGEFLKFLDSEIQSNPGRLQVATKELSDRIFARVRNLPLDFDIDAPLTEDV
jgi:antitoxin PrlF